MKKILSLAAFALCCFALPAQTGPAGVGTSASNVFWLKADAGPSSTVNLAPISTWSDQSGNGINMSQTVTAQQPSFATNIINGFPAVQFDNVNAANQNDKMLGPDSPVLDNTTGYTFFTVTRPQNFGDAHVIVSKRTTVSVDQSFMLFYYTSNKMTIDVQTTNDRFASNTAFSTNTNYIIDLVYDGTIANPRCTLYEGETPDINANETSTLVPDNASPIILGTTDAGDPRPYGGYMSEIIIYRETLVPAKRIIVNNYLSAKYNISLSANDKYAGDNSGNGDYDFEVAGIGQESTGSNTSFSASICGGLGMAATAGLDNTDYILAGHATPVNSVITTDVAGLSGVNKARWQRVWYIDVTNTLTNLSANVEFDLSDGGLPGTPGTASDYRLLYRAGQTGSWTELATATSISGDKIEFANTALTNDGYYTIGSINYFSSPLPIGLINFDASVNGGQVDLDWATATEKNNAYFTVEKSSNGQNFVPVGTLKGALNSSTRLNYKLTDAEPYEGISYYRLRQTDVNNSSTLSAPVVVNVGAAEKGIRIYPNPSNGLIFISLPQPASQAVEVSLYDRQGKTCLHKTYAAGTYAGTLTLDTEGRLATGYYVITVSFGPQSLTQQIIIR